ncbi:zinc-dependent alcohol dehydrogenase [Candidatus Hecatella orcuttiae]|uniref:zinc-dependent alcohol dehydrogenase n=1 Tax=Candidatus Hecatella orcuttiae TaxID=1935119 RepID=UPI002868249F|nr:alcohol dehydrogenase catalytic domain-containing protein [Candidatus Hecatella orcuttiae]
MKAAVLHNPNDLRVEETPTPGPPSLGEVIVRVKHCAVCGTDLHAYLGHIPAKTPLILGHEYAGKVFQVGQGVRMFKVGDNVIGSYVASCGVCKYCTAGKQQLCERRILFGLNYDGAFAQFMRVPHAERVLVKIPENMDPKQAVLVPDMFLTGFYAAERGGVSLGFTVLVSGLGPIGLSALIASKLAGASKVIGVDIREKPLELARKFGADHVINAKGEVNVVKEVMNLTEGAGVDVGLETAGVPATVTSTLESIKPSGRYVQVAIVSKPVEINLSYVTSLERTIIGVLNPGSTNHIRRALELVKTRNVNLLDFVTHEIALENINEAFEIFSNPEKNRKENPIKVIVNLS